MITISHNKENFTNILDLFSEELKIYGIIYKISNLITGKIYIGQTVFTAEKRFSQHVKSSMDKKPKQYIHRSMNKYGIEFFTVEKIDEAYTSDELNQKEYDWIIKEDCMAPNGYNLRAGGGRPGFSEETRKRMREFKSGGKWFHDPIDDKEYYIFSSETCPDHLIEGRNAKHSENNKIYRTGTHHTEETIAKMVEAHKNSDKEHIRAIRSDRSMGRCWYHNKTTQKEHFIYEKDADCDMIRGRNGAHMEKMKNKNPTRHTEESKKKISETSKNSFYYHNPITEKNIRITKYDEIPDGFIPGRVPRKRKWCFSRELNEEILIDIEKDELPAGYEFGRLGW
jgi:group I intron endonuclease